MHEEIAPSRKHNSGACWPSCRNHRTFHGGIPGKRHDLLFDLNEQDCKVDVSCEVVGLSEDSTDCRNTPVTFSLERGTSALQVSQQPFMSRTSMVKFTSSADSTTVGSSASAAQCHFMSSGTCNGAGCSNCSFNQFAWASSFNGLSWSAVHLPDRIFGIIELGDAGELVEEVLSRRLAP